LKSGARAAASVVDAVLPSEHTGNTVPTLTLKISKQLKSQITAAAKRREISISELVRQGIERELREHTFPGPSLYDLSRDLCGISNRGISDLSTNKKHMEGFGLTGPAYREFLKKKQSRDRRSR
jgi:hypothetical protein